MLKKDMFGFYSEREKNFFLASFFTFELCYQFSSVASEKQWSLASTFWLPTDSLTHRQWIYMTVHLHDKR